VKVLDHIEEWIITFLIGAATLIIFVAVMHRYAAGLPIPGVQDWLLQINLTWAQELCIIMFVWMAKFGAAYGVQDRHPRRRRRADQHRCRDARAPSSSFSACCPVRLFTGIIARARRAFRLGERRPLRHHHSARHQGRRAVRRSDHARPGVADLDGVFGHSARIVPDVLSASCRSR
jgi:hypothetical protein